MGAAIAAPIPQLLTKVTNSIGATLGPSPQRRADTYASDLRQVFEASGRFGGRIHTNRAGWFGDQTAEWCGELIDSSHVTLRGLAKRFGLPLTDVFAGVPPDAQYTLFLDGLPRRASRARLQTGICEPASATARSASTGAPYTTTLESPTARHDVEAFLAQIERVFPGSARHYAGNATVGRAFLDPFIGGSYSVWLVGQLAAFGGCEGRAEGPIHFAGEHT